MDKLCIHEFLVQYKGKRFEYKFENFPKNVICSFKNTEISDIMKFRNARHICIYATSLKHLSNIAWHAKSHLQLLSLLRELKLIASAYKFMQSICIYSPTFNSIESRTQQLFKITFAIVLDRVIKNCKNGFSYCKPCVY